MNRDMPPPLRARVDAEPPDRRRRLARAWSLAGTADAPPPDAPDVDAAWAALAPRLKRPPDRPARRRTRRWTVALGLPVLLLAAGLWWRQPVAITVPPGGRAAVTLPDGSTVELNSASRLTYARAFGAWPLRPAAQRRVHLTGEAFFDVVPDAAHPFVVETAGARVEVLGTRFNVRARPERTEVALVSGRVRVTEAGRPPVVLARAGQTARLGADPVRITPLDQVLAWRRQGFTAIDEPVGAVLAEVERRFALTIDAGAGLPLDAPMTLFYQHDATAEKILHDLCLSQGCRYRRTSGGYALYADD